jgi:AmiR/NasT family two-component response regulator
VGQEVPDPAEVLSATVGSLRNERDGLRRAMRTRAIIEQAKGVLAEVGGLDMGEAFVRLRDHAHETRQPLTELARGIASRTVGTDFLRGGG